MHEKTMHDMCTYTYTHTHILPYIHPYHQDPVGGDGHELVAAPVQVVLVHHVT